MARYDVYPNPQGRGWMLDVQSDLLGDLNTRVVVPLLKFGEAPLPAKRLNPVFQIEGVEVMMATQFLSAVPATRLVNPAPR